jgi:SEC-C motif
MDTIRQAFQHKSVDISIVGDEEDVEIALKLRTRRSRPRPDFRIAVPGWSECSDVEQVLSRTGTTRRTINVGRNDPCPCGSGKKYKKCCLP